MNTINVGIDLGTTYSAVAVFHEGSGKVEILKNDIGEETTPSVVCIENGAVLIGQEAKNEQAAGNINTAAFYKSMMGDPNFKAVLDGKSYSAEDLSGIFLKELKKSIESANNVTIGGAVITVPAYFNEAQRQATIRAGEKAGFRVLKIINEPTAAIIAYGLTGQGKKTAMVYDLGGGTFDVTIAKIDGANVEVIATNGDHCLGGRNWDRIIVDDVVEQFKDEFDVNIAANKEDYNELIVKCEKIKKQLTQMPSAPITVSSEGFTGRYNVTREMFETRSRRLLTQTIALTKLCFSEIGGGFSWKSIDEVVLVGGSTRMPQVSAAIEQEFGKPPRIIGNKVDTIVASGAAMQAQLCTSGTITLSLDGPSARPQSQGTTGGAAAPAFTLTLSNDSIKDVTSHSLGMIAFSKSGEELINSIILKKNSKTGIPYGKAYTHYNSTMDIYVMQGELESPYEGTLLYRYVVSGMKPGRKNDITVYFQYNQNGVVEASCCLADGTKLPVSKSNITETVDELLERLKREREEQRQRAYADVAFAIDTSGSMSGTPIEQAKRSILESCGQFKNTPARFSVIQFDSQSSWICKDAEGERELRPAVGRLQAHGGTSADPMKRYLDEKRLNEYGPNILFVLTDGEWCHQESAVRNADQLKSMGVIIYAIGFGDADYEFLRRIASDGGAKKVDLSRLVETFKEISGTIATEASNH